MQTRYPLKTQTLNCPTLLCGLCYSNLTVKCAYAHVQSPLPVSYQQTFPVAMVQSSTLMASKYICCLYLLSSWQLFQSFLLCIKNIFHFIFGYPIYPVLILLPQKQIILQSPALYNQLYPICISVWFCYKHLWAFPHSQTLSLPTTAAFLCIGLFHNHFVTTTDISHPHST